MSNVVAFTGGRRCLVCHDQIDPQRVRENPDLTTCDSGCQITCDADALDKQLAYQAMADAAAKRDTLTL